MKTLLTILISICLFTPSYSQSSANINDLKPAEVRSLLLSLDDEDPIKILTKKHNASRISAYSFLAVSVIMAIASDETVDPDTDGKNSIMLATGAGIGFAIAGICGIVAGERLKKAKEMYINSNPYNQKNSFIQIRDEAKVLDSVF